MTATGRRSLPALAALLSALSLPCAATTLDTDYSGQWVGQGTLAIGMDAPDRRARCEVEVSATEHLRDLAISGICAVAAARRTFALTITWLEDGQLSAGMQAEGLSGTAHYAGALTRDVMELQSTSVFLLDDLPFLSRISITFDGGQRFSMTEWMRPAGTDEERQTMAMTFVRQTPP